MPYLFGDLTSYHFSCQTHVPAFLLYETIQIILLTQDGPIYSLPRTRLSFLPCRSPTSLHTRSPNACRSARRMFSFGVSLPNGVLPPSCPDLSAEPRSYTNALGASLRRLARARRSFAPATRLSSERHDRPRRSHVLLMRTISSSSLRLEPGPSALASSDPPSAIRVGRR